MTRLTKSERHSLAAHKDWIAWGEKFGFRLYGSNDEHLGHFVLPSGDAFMVPLEARQLIDAALSSDQCGGG